MTTPNHGGGQWHIAERPDHPVLEVTRGADPNPIYVEKVIQGAEAEDVIVAPQDWPRAEKEFLVGIAAEMITGERPSPADKPPLAADVYLP
jgi:hypothetical protein